MKRKYRGLATRYAEKHGIIDYTVFKSMIIYYTNYPQERNTYKVICDLDTHRENRQRLERYYKKGNNNICL